MAFRGNTGDLGSCGEETDKITDLHQFHEEALFTESRDGVTGIKRRRRDPSSDGVRDLVMASGQDLALYDNESWNNLRDFVKPVKAIALPQDVPSTSDSRLIELKNQVQRLMEAHLSSTQPNQVNKITTSCEICSGPHDTQYCIEDPKQAFVEYASSRTDEAGGLVSNFMASQDVRLIKFEADFKQQQSEMTKKIDTVLKAITDRIAGALPSDTVKNPKLSTYPVLSACSDPTKDPQCSTHVHGSINNIMIHPKQQNDSRDSMTEEEKQEREGDPEDTNTIAYVEERRDTPLLEGKDIADVGNLGYNKDDGGIEWLDAEEPLDLVDTSEESVLGLEFSSIGLGNRGIGTGKTQEMAKYSTNTILFSIDSGANDRPPMLEKGNYIPWESRFRRFLDNKLEDRERTWNSIQNGPYERQIIPNPDNTHKMILEPLSKIVTAQVLGHYARDYQKPRVYDAKYFREQMLLAMKDEAESNLNNEENDFMLDTSYANGNAKTVSSYDAKAVSEVNASSKFHEQMRHGKHKTIIQTSDDDQIYSNIIFDDPYAENNGGTSDHDSNDHDEYHKIQMLAYDVQRETEKQKQLNNKLKKQKMLKPKELKTSKKAFKEGESRYLEDICDLEEKLSSHDRIVYKMGQSIETIQMLGKTPNKVYDHFLKTGLGYKNPKCLKKAIAAQPKMYDGEKLYSINLKIDSPDSEETLEDAE
ncbi:hypothetical protein Tco_0225975 [Tanacetum coccineum]